MNSLALIQWQSPGMLGTAFLVLVGVLLAVALLYPGQTRTVPARWRWVLGALRAAALAALAISIARPATTRDLKQREQGAIVIIADHSASMYVRDPRKPGAASLVALADGMGMLAPGVRQRFEAFEAIAPEIGRLPGMLDAVLQAQVEVEFALLQGRENPEAEARLKETGEKFVQMTKKLALEEKKIRAKNNNLADALRNLGKIPPVQSTQWLPSTATQHVDELTRQASAFQGSSDQELYRANAEVKSICDRLASYSRFELAQHALGDAERGLLRQIPAEVPLFGFAVGTHATPLPLRAGTQSVHRLIVPGHATASDLAGGVREVMDQMRNQPVRAVLFFSDGRQVGATGSIASSLFGSSVPIYAINTAAGMPISDAAIESVSLASSVFVGEILEVEVAVRWVGMRPSPDKVELSVAGKRETAKLAPGKDNQSGVARFAIRMDEPGPREISLLVPAAENEISDANNVARRWVKVLSDRLDVLILAGAPTWDYRYLRNALSRTRWVDAESIMLDAENARLQSTSDQLLRRDVIILCDVSPRALSSEQWEALRKLVAQRGGSVIMMAGRAHLPREYTADALLEWLPYKRTPARGLSTPVWKVWPGEEPNFRAVPAPGAPANLWTLEENPAAAVASDLWLALPPVFRYLALPELKENVQPLLVEQETGSPVLTRHRLGRGQVYFLGIDETWRWRYKVGERDQDRFFRQLIRNAADAPFAVTDGVIALDADQVVLRPRQAMRARARVIDPQPTDESISLELVKGQALIPIVLSPVGGAESGRYEASVSGLDAGEYLLRLTGPGGARVEYPLHVREDYEAELLNLSPDEEWLKRLASSSGGQYLTLENMRNLAKRLTAMREGAPKTGEFRLWDSWYLYWFVLGCLGLEWAMRKKLGLV